MIELDDLKRKRNHHLRKLRTAKSSGDPRKMARTLLSAAEFWKELVAIKAEQELEQPKPELRKSYALETWMEGRNRVHKEPWMSTSRVGEIVI